MKIRRISTINLVLCALFAALTAVCSQIAIPIGPVPVNLAMLSVFVAGGLLGHKYGTLSQVVYVLIGAIGAPVFSGFSGGLGIIIGKTGGYIAGYILAAFLTGFLIKKLKFNYFIVVISMITGLVACYTLGTAWFMFVTKIDLVTSLMYCVVPFLIGDVLKIALGSFLVIKLKPILHKSQVSSNKKIA